MIANIYSIRFRPRYPDVPLFLVGKGIEAGGGDTSAGVGGGGCIEGGTELLFLLLYTSSPTRIHLCIMSTAMDTSEDDLQTTTIVSNSQSSSGLSISM